MRTKDWFVRNILLLSMASLSLELEAKSIIANCMDDGAALLSRRPKKCAEDWVKSVEKNMAMCETALKLMSKDPKSKEQRKKIDKTIENLDLSLEGCD